MHSRKCNEVLVDDIGDIAESSGEEEPESRGPEEEIGSSSNILQSDKDGASILLPNSFLSETVSSQLCSADKQPATRSFLMCSEKTSNLLNNGVGGSMQPSDAASSQLSSDNQTAADKGFLKTSDKQAAADRDFLKTSEASLLQMCLERSEKTSLTDQL